MRPHRATPIDRSPQVRPRPLRRRNHLPYLRPRRLLTSPLSFVNSGLPPGARHLASPLSFVNSGLPPARRGGAHRRLVEPVFRLATGPHHGIQLIEREILPSPTPAPASPNYPS